MTSSGASPVKQAICYGKLLPRLEARVGSYINLPTLEQPLPYRMAICGLTTFTY